MKVRRVVTGHTPEGKSIVASDTEVDPVTTPLDPELEFHVLWGADTTPTFPDDGSPRPIPIYFPPLGGFRFVLFTISPDSSLPPEGLDIEAEEKKIVERFPDVYTYMEPDHPGMHTTDTIDFEYVLSGEVWLELDDGVQVHLRPGDTVVQNGTRHAWRNKGTEVCRMVCILIGAHRQR